MHLFMATLSTETNTFSPIPTALRGYEDYFLRHGTATDESPNLMTEALHVWRERAEALGWRVTESLAAVAEPAGPTVAAAYSALKGEILDDLGDARPDIVLLQLHGAMVAEDVDDCEGDIARAARALCPDAVIGLALDLHGHVTRAMLEAADLIVLFKEYPHDDASERARELFELARRTRAGEIVPVMATHDCRMSALYLTKGGAMGEFVRHMHRTEERPGILSVSLAHGFPWADLPEADARTVVIADGDAGLATDTARELGDAFFARRHAVTKRYVDLDTALDQAHSASAGPVVLADMSDNSGAGAPGDATHVLRALLERELPNVASGLYWDPMAVRFCRDAGEGAEVRLRLGGKTETASGTPVDLSARVMRIASGLGQHLGRGREPLGTVVWLRAANELDLVVNDLRTQVYHPEAFRQLGIRLEDKRLVVVKSLFHFYTPFAEIASRIVFAATPGRTDPETRRLAYRRRSMNFWPRVDDPFGVDERGGSSSSPSDNPAETGCR